MNLTEDGVKYFKGKYLIAFYNKEDTCLLHMFDNIKEICRYKNLEDSLKSYNLIKVELYRALKREDHFTRMLNGSLMRVYTIDMTNED